MPRKNANAQPPRRTKSLPRLNSCLHKRRFRSQHEAQEAAEFGMLQDMNLELSIYQCSLCRAWHLTSR